MKVYIVVATRNGMSINLGAFITTKKAREFITTCPKYSDYSVDEFELDEVVK